MLLFLFLSHSFTIAYAILCSYPLTHIIASYLYLISYTSAVSKASVSDVVYQFKTSSRKRQRDSEEAVEAAVAERAAAMRLEVERAATEKVQREMRLEVERVSAEKAQLTAALEERAQAEAQTARALHEAQAQATAHASALQQLQRDLQARDEVRLTTLHVLPLILCRLHEHKRRRRSDSPQNWRRRSVQRAQPLRARRWLSDSRVQCVCVHVDVLTGV